MHPQDHINLHSEELNEALGTPPSWIARFGVQSAYLAIIVLLAAAFFVKYPDVVEAPMILTVPNPAVELVAKKTGLLEHVLVEHNETVEIGQLIASFASTANLMDIDTLEKNLQFFSDRVFAEDIQRFKPLLNLQLGSIQEAYTVFLKDYNALKFGVMSNNEMKTIARKRSEITELENSIFLEEKRLDGLSNRRAIAQTSINRLKSEYLDDPKESAKKLDEYSVEIAKIEDDSIFITTKINNYRRNIKEIQNEIAEFRQSTGSDQQFLTFQIEKQINNLKSQIRLWKNDNLLYAPIAGRVIFNKNFGVENQTVRPGDLILEIYPADDIGQVFAKVDLPNFNSGSVESGQEVVIKVNNYPHLQHGIIKGIVRSKADVLQEDRKTYLVEVNLPEGLLTSFGKELEFSQGMQGTAEIITKEKRLLYRLFDNVFSELHL